MNTSKEMCELLFLQGQLMNNLELQISFLHWDRSHNKAELQKILDQKQADLEEKISTLKEEIELKEKKVA